MAARFLPAVLALALGLAAGTAHADEAVVWRGRDPLVTVVQLAAYAGPILWFSPDEPLLAARQPRVVDLPEPFPFEPDEETPVVYYRLRTVAQHEDAAGGFSPNARDRGQSVLDLRRIAAIELDYFFYYRSELGKGAHEHDVESAEMKLEVEASLGPDGPLFTVAVREVVGKAHGVVWYDNVLEADEFTSLPIHILVEEGKHASATDKNGDGVFTPGFDVSRRINDAWGVRDILRTGLVFAGGFEAWMAKPRDRRDRVFPPLPDDSPLRGQFPVYPPEGAAVYGLRPFPPGDRAAPDLRPFITSKGDADWPEVIEDTTAHDIAAWLTEDPLARSVSVAYRYDGDSGLSVVLPLLVLRAVNDPLTGGWLTNRLYFKDVDPPRFGWTLQYSLSAARWIDGYAAAGGELLAPAQGGWEFVAESGIKFRARIKGTPLHFLTVLTDFWGLRVGVRSVGLFRFSRIGYLLELGAGAF